MLSAQLTAGCPEKVSTNTTHSWMRRSEYSLPLADWIAARPAALNAPTLSVM